MGAPHGVVQTDSFRTLWIVMESQGNHKLEMCRCISVRKMTGRVRQRNELFFPIYLQPQYVTLPISLLAFYVQSNSQCRMCRDLFSDISVAIRVGYFETPHRANTNVSDKHDNKR